MSNKTKAIIGVGVVAIIAIALIVIFVGGSNGTKLTLDNYDDYLKVDASTNRNEAIKSKLSFSLLGDEYSTKIFSDAFTANGYVQATTSNFNFNDVKLTFRVHGTTVMKEKYPPYGVTGDLKSFDFDFTFTVELDIAGNGSGSSTCNLPTNMVTDGRVCTSMHSTTPSPYITIELIGITGTVTPA